MFNSIFLVMASLKTEPDIMLSRKCKSLRKKESHTGSLVLNFKFWYLAINLTCPDFFGI